MLLDRTTFFAIAASLITFPAVGCTDTATGTVEVRRSDGAVDPLSGGKGGGGGAGQLDDAGVGDASNIDLDGATMDAAVLGLDASLALPPGTWITPDGKIVLPDGEVIDVDTAVKRYTPELDVSKCAIGSEDHKEIEVDFSEEGGFALVPGLEGFGLAYSSTGGQTCSNNIALMPIPASSGFPDPRFLLSETSCSLTGDVALVSKSDGYQVAWVDNSTGTDELFSAPLTSAFKREERDAHAQVNPKSDVLEPERKPALCEVDGRIIVTWFVKGDQLSAGDAIYSRVLGTDDVHEIIPVTAGHRPLALSLATMSKEAAALVWVSTGTQPAVWLQRLDKDGLPFDDEAPILLSELVAPSSSVSVATRAGDSGGGAIVYSVVADGFKQIRFRRLDPMAAPFANDSERVLIASPLQAEAASLYGLGGGYVVTYRAVPAGIITTPEVRLTFVTKDGSTQRDEAGHLVSFPIEACSASGTRTTTAVSNEGQVMVGWIDSPDDSSSNNKILKLVRRRLDCQ